MKVINKIDNMAFPNREEAIKFFEENYLIEQRDENMITQIIDAIKKVISDDSRVEVKIENENHYMITVKNKDYSIDSCLVIEDDNNQHSYWGSEYRSLESVVNFFKFATEAVEEIIEKVKQKYDFKEFKFDRYHDDFGNGNYFDFSYVTNEEESFQVTYEGGELAAFIEQFKQHFVSSLEGNYEKILDQGYFIDYSIDNVPIAGLLRRAESLNKKIRLEIVD